ncbi:MAG: hypothetical protein ACFFDT_18345 [Candidatus Hodarchaeota archaeon]
MIKLKKWTSLAVSPMIATILILGIIVGGLAIGIVFVIPYRDRIIAESTFESMKTGFKDINREILSLISKSTPASNETTQIKLAMRSGAISSYDPTTLTLYLNDSTSLTYFSPRRLRYAFHSDHEFLPIGTKKYLLGSDPWTPRSISTSRLTGNLTLIHPINSHYFIELDYGLSVLSNVGTDITGADVFVNVTITGIRLEGIAGGIIDNNPTLSLKVTNSTKETIYNSGTKIGDATVSLDIDGDGAGDETCWTTPSAITENFYLRIIFVLYTITITSG